MNDIQYEGNPIFKTRVVKHLALALFYTSLLMVTAANAEIPRSDWESYIVNKMQQHNVVGASIGVMRNGRVDEVLHLGLESIETKVPISGKSVFQVGSVSKPVSAWVAMTLVREGKIDLDEPISTYLTRWRIPESQYDINNVTLRRLLSHTAGINLSAYGGFPDGVLLPTLEESLTGSTDGTKRVELFQQPGQNFSYSGGGYTLIQLLVEEVSGMAFSDYAQQAVLQPLGMNDSSYEPDFQLLKRRIQPHSVSATLIPQRDFRAQAAASLHTTVKDLMRFVFANLYENSVFEIQEISQMHAVMADAGFADIGLGIFISSQGRLIGHAGSNFGWRAEFQLDKQTADALIIMTNSEASDQFLAELKCEWDSRRASPVLAKQCSDRKTKINSAKIAIVIIASSILACLCLLISVLVRSKARLSLPRTKTKIIGLGLLLSFTLFLIVFMYTPLGVYLIADFKSITATVYYAPPHFAILTPWVCGTLIMGCLAFFIERVKTA